LSKTTAENLSSTESEPIRRIRLLPIWRSSEGRKKKIGPLFENRTDIFSFIFDVRKNKSWETSGREYYS